MAPGRCGTTCVVWAASDRAIDAATGAQGRPRRRRTAPPDLGERQVAAVAPNDLDRSFQAPAPNHQMDCGLHLCVDSRRLALRGCRGRSVLAACGRLVGSNTAMTSAARHRCPGDGNLATRRARCAAASLRSRQPIHQRAVPAADGRQRHRLLDEPLRQRLRQCGDGELLLLAQDRAHRRARRAAHA